MKLRSISLGIALVLLAASAYAGTIEGVVKATPGTSATEFVVSIEDLKAGAPSAARNAVMDQRSLRFVPHVLPIVVGTTVDFTNSDPLAHNVYSISEPKRFNLGLYAKGQSRRITFDRVGVVQVLCNVHLEMSAIVVVLPNPYFALPAGDGTFRIAGVPAGHYRLRCWHEKLAAVEHEIEVPASGTVNASFRLE